MARVGRVPRVLTILIVCGWTVAAVRTLHLYGVGMSDSNSHDPRNLPILIFGGGGQIKGGRHLKYTEAQPAANLLVNVVDKLGISVEKIGNSSGELNIDIDTLSGL